MRISTSQFYDNAALGIQRNQSSLYKLQNQLSTGRRVLTPEDDPVAAAQALIVAQSQAVNGQHLTNQQNATGQLRLVDSQLTSLVNVMQDVREKIVQAGNTATLSNTDRQAIATELESRLGEIVGIANSQNGAGDYLFSGYRGATLPFAINGSNGSYAYDGDDGERLLQVSSSRQMAVSVAGSDVFMNARAGNGSFVTGTGGNVGGGINQGSALVDGGSLIDPQKWKTGLNGFAWTTPANPALQVRFSVAVGATTYQLFDVSNVAAPQAMTAPAAFTPGQAIPLAATNPPAATTTDFGAQFVVTGQPANNDTFIVRPSSSQSLFQTMQNVITTLRSPLGSATYSATEYSNRLGAQLSSFDQAFANISRVQASVGTRMNEVDSLSSASSDLDIQYQDSLSKLEGLDYVKAISDFTMQQTYLEAAQKSFAKISGLSLFDYL